MTSAAVPVGFPSIVPDDFNLLHIAIYEGMTRDMARQDCYPDPGVDFSDMWIAVRTMHDSVVNSVYVDVNRPAEPSE